jgi:hypothetical protein
MRHSIAQLAAEQRAEFYRFIEERLAPYASGGGRLRLPSARNILLATA